jgi:uncharacterized protein YabE (DUF348 family)
MGMDSREAQRRFMPLLALLILGGILSLGLAAFLLSQKTYTIYDGMEAITVNGRFAAVDDVLQAAAITLRPEDFIQPAEDAPATAVIQIQRAQPVTLLRDGSARLQSAPFWPKPASRLDRARNCSPVDGPST